MLTCSQLLKDQQAAAARNAVLQGYINNANAFGAQNQAAPLGQGIAAFNPNRLGADTAARGATISKAIGTGPDMNIPLRKGAAAPVGRRVHQEAWRCVCSSIWARRAARGGWRLR